MKGLLVKDRYICTKQVSTVLLTVLCLFICVLLYEYPSIVDMMGYILALGFVFACLSEDDRTGYSYLMSMPVDAKTYVIEKNIYAFALFAFFWICTRVSIIIGTLTIGRPDPLRLSNVFGLSSMGYLFAMSVASAAVPLVLKFGALKAFYILFTLPWICCAYSIIDSMFVYSSLEKVIEFFENLYSRSHGLIYIGCIVFNALLVGLFIALGIRVMKKKEF